MRPLTPARRRALRVLSHALGHLPYVRFRDRIPAAGLPREDRYAVAFVSWAWLTAVLTVAACRAGWWLSGQCG